MLFDDRDPGGERGTGQGGGLGKIEMGRDRQDRVLAEHAVLAGDPVHRRAQIEGEPLCVRRPALPAGEEAADHAIARAPARHALAELDDFAGSVGERNEVAPLLLRAIAALDGDEIAVVERGGAQPHQHLARARTRLRPLDDLQVVEP